MTRANMSYLWILIRCRRGNPAGITVGEHMTTYIQQRLIEIRSFVWMWPTAPLTTFVMYFVNIYLNI